MKILILFLSALIGFSSLAFADHYEITLHQVNPNGAMFHKRLCDVGKTCAHILELPVQVGASGMVLDVAIAIKSNQGRNILDIGFKADHHTLTTASRGYVPYSAIFLKEDRRTDVITLYALNPNSEKDDLGSGIPLVLRPSNTPIADLEISVKRLP